VQGYKARHAIPLVLKLKTQFGSLKLLCAKSLHCNLDLQSNFLKVFVRTPKEFSTMNCLAYGLIAKGPKDTLLTLLFERGNDAKDRSDVPFIIRNLKGMEKNQHLTSLYIEHPCTKVNFTTHENHLRNQVKPYPQL